MTRLAKLLFLATFIPPAAAQDEGTPEPAAEPRRYAVEIIIFEYAEDFAAGSEVFVPDLLEEDPAAENEPALVFEDVPTVEAAVPRARIRQLEEDELSMRETYNRLRRLDAYSPLMFFGWVQETVPDLETAALPIQEFGEPPEGLTGSVSLDLRRYLHLGVDLALASDEEYQPPVPGYLEERDANGMIRFDEQRTRVRYAPLSYELREERIMKSGDVRYYDHPKFGVVAKVRRIEEDERQAAGGGQR